MQQLLEMVRSMSAEIAEEVVSIRRHLHQHPELSFKEYRSSEFVCSILEAHGIPFTAGIVETGVVALVEGTNPQQKTILLRADLDALPIEEKNNVPYRSCNPGVMHACGHDVHTASVLGTAIILNRLRDRFEGTVKFMFQPGEEVLPGGSSLMIREGVLQHPAVDAAIAQHVFPSMETGKVGFRQGMYMASTDELHITISGKGGHAAMAGEYNNPLVVAAHVITEIERQFSFEVDAEGVARNTDNHIPTVVVFGKIEGKGATNVIPESVYLAGTLRTMDEAWRLRVKERIREIVQGICEAYRAKADINIIDGYPCLINDPKVTETCRQSAIEYLGAEHVEELPLRMTAEDFAYVSQQVPSCFYRLGTGNRAKGITAGVHTATFDIDERALGFSTGLMAWMTLRSLKS